MGFSKVRLMFKLFPPRRCNGVVGMGFTPSRCKPSTVPTMGHCNFHAICCNFIVPVRRISRVSVFKVVLPSRKRAL